MFFLLQLFSLLFTYGKRRRGMYSTLRRKRLFKLSRRPRRRGYRRLARGYRRYKGRGISKWKLATRTVVPDELFVKVRATDVLTSINNAGFPTTLTTTVFRGNSAYDMRFALGGPSTYGHAEYAALYQNYLVFGSKINVYVRNQTDADTLVGVVPYTTSGLSSGSDYTAGELETMKNIPYAVCKQMCPATATVASNFAINMLGGKGFIKSYMSTAKIFGITKQRVKDDPNFQAGVLSNPATAWYWIVYATCMDQATACQITHSATITFYMKYFNRNRFIA